MVIADLLTCSLSDYPGKIAAVVFTRGCNFRCPFCHNGSLIPLHSKGQLVIPHEHFFQFLACHNDCRDGVVVSGGEPTIHNELPGFLKKIKDTGYAVKLDTNGSRPEMIKKVLDDKLVDYIAMDIKAPLEKYEILAGCCLTSGDINNIKESIYLIAKSGIDHEFRTTVVEPLLSPQDLHRIQQLIPAGSRYKLQKFCPEHAFDPKLRERSDIFKGDCLL